MGRRSSVGVGVLCGVIYAVGGYDGNSRMCLSSVEVYNPNDDVWIRVADMSARRSGVALPDGRTQVVTYTADHTNGFIADVKYEGKPHYGPAPHAPVHGPKYHPAPIHKPIPHHPAPYRG